MPRLFGSKLQQHRAAAHGAAARPLGGGGAFGRPATREAVQAKNAPCCFAQGRALFCGRFVRYLEGARPCSARHWSVPLLAAGAVLRARYRDHRHHTGYLAHIAWISACHARLRSGSVIVRKDEPLVVSMVGSHSLRPSKGARRVGLTHPREHNRAVLLDVAEPRTSSGWVSRSPNSLTLIERSETRTGSNTRK